MNTNHDERMQVEKLIKKGVRIPCPDSLEIGREISVDRISGNGVVIHAGCKIFGSETLIMDGVQLGYEAPATINNCQLGRKVELKGGFFERSVFLEGAAMGSGAQIREACLLEEGAKGAHTVGLKHTILFPFVTLGSLINFCDCLMSGGTDAKNHSEVGSSYIHFNYTPNQDKATASLIGDVPRGVMINQDPIFLGGQGGIVGPVRMEYGNIVAAGTIIRKDILKKNVMLLGHTSFSKTIHFRSGLYTTLKRIIRLNTIYISNLVALRRWYLDIRAKFNSNNYMESALHKGAVDKIEMAIDERLKRLGEVAKKMPRSIDIHKQKAGEKASENLFYSEQEFFDRWPDIEGVIRDSYDLEGNTQKKEMFLNIIDKRLGSESREYIKVIKGLSENESKLGIDWLQELVEDISRKVFILLPTLKIK
jgi:UDP-N-acetylglucosamine/UDP-N-acetylgalactosamine diphosphorylase